MVEYTNLQDNSEEIMNCIVNCDKAEEDNDVKEALSNNTADVNKDEYMDEL